MKKLLLTLALLAFGSAAEAQWQVPLNNVPIGRGPGVQGFSSIAPGSNGNCLVVAGGLWASLPCTPTVTPGGSSGQVQYNNGGAFGGLTDVQVTARIQQFTSVLPGAVPASGGGTTNFLRADGTFAAPSASQTQNYLSGLILSNDFTADQSNELALAAGQASDSTNADTIVLAAPLSRKKVNVAWALGSNAGCLDTGAINNNTTYWEWLIKKPSTGDVDLLCSLSPSAPTMPALFTEKRRIGGIIRQQAVLTGSVTGTTMTITGVTSGVVQMGADCTGAGITASSFTTAFITGQGGTGTYTLAQSSAATGSITITCTGNLQFTQDGDYFGMANGQVDFNLANPGTTAVLRTLTVPIGLRVQVVMSENLTHATDGSNTGFALLITDPATSDIVPRNPTATLTMTSINGSNMANSNVVRVFTNTSGQVRTRLSASVANLSLEGGAIGWYDSRGQ